MNLITELVNLKINNYPAVFEIKKAPDTRAFSMLSLISDKYGYVFYQVGKEDDSKLTLSKFSKLILDENKE